MSKGDKVKKNKKTRKSPDVSRAGNRGGKPSKRRENAKAGAVPHHLAPLHQDLSMYDDICTWCPLPPKLMGKKVFLTAFDPEYTDDFMKIITDETTAAGLGDPLATVYSREQERGFLSQGGGTFSDDFHFMIWDVSDKRIIGSCSLMNLHPVHRSAELGINIGSRPHRNGGRGTEAMRLLLDFGFQELNLNRIELGVHDFNLNARACYRKCGFKEVGRRREAMFVHGKYHDSIVMDILASEYFATAPAGDKADPAEQEQVELAGTLGHA